MRGRPAPFDIDDAKPFDANLQGFFETLGADNPALAAVLKAELPKLLADDTEKTAIWDALLAAAAESEAS